MRQGEVAPRLPQPALEMGPPATLLEIGETLASQLALRPALERVLEKLQRDAGVLRGAVMILDGAAKKIEVSLGFGADAQRDRYKPGGGITARVVESGRPVVVAAVSREPLLVHRVPDGRGSVSELTFICVPIMLDGRPVGALSVDLMFDPARDYQGAQRFFALVAAMIAQVLKVHRMVEGEERRDETKALRTELKQRYDFSAIVGTSGPIRKAHEQIAQVARTNTT